MSFKNNSKGFTITELLIATAVFSLVLLVFMAAFLRIGQLFYKGVYMSNTQEAARSIVQGVADDLRLSSSDSYSKVSASSYCIGNHSYRWMNAQQVTGPNDLSHGIVRDDSCSSAGNVNSEQLLGSGMQANNFDISPIASTKAYVIKLHLVYYGGDSSVLVSPSDRTPAVTAQDATCSGSVKGSQFCAVADYNSTVLQTY
jgi:prepilin-type N-terminal cleavage/methylation domain-containing protein